MEDYSRPKLIRITTVPVSLKTLLKGQLRFMHENAFEVVGVSSPGIELQEAAQNEGVRVVPVEMTRTISPLKDLKSVWKLFFFFRREKPQIVHTHTPKAGIAGMLAARLAGVPHRLHTVAGLPLLEAKGIKRVLLNVVEKATYACATRVYPNSYGLFNIIIQNRYTRAEKLKVIGNGSSNGIDTTRFCAAHFSEAYCQQLRHSLQIQPDDFVFIFVGRMVGDKGINELVGAFSKMTGQGKSGSGDPHIPGGESVTLKSGVKLLLIGNFERDLDPLLPDTEREINTNPDIIFAGYQSDVRPFFAISDCLVFPSYREGFPNVVMQAGAMELPAIVSNINGCNEIVEEGKNGMIVEPKDQEALQSAMKYVLEHRVDYDKLKQHARDMITSRYEQSVIWAALLEEYRNLLVQNTGS
ncbi:glycosyltransferase family 4 protein [Ravibacter arvi]